MPLKFRQNQYRGVNAHLHSALQNEFDAWGVFHGLHIADLTREINLLLPEGYVVEPERGMQIRQYHPDSGEDTSKLVSMRRKTDRPDLTIYQTETVQPASQSAFSAVATAPTERLSSKQSVEDDWEIYLMAVVIHEITSDGKIGKPITWIEVLSPNNKPGGSGFTQYREKRLSALASGLVLVEMDYVHQKRSPNPWLASYPDREPNAYPYSIVVTDPRPSLKRGEMSVYGLHVDDPLPVTEIPLAVGDKPILLDFGAVYTRTYESLKAFSLRVDYEQLPERFDTYMEVDQERIRARMQAVAQQSLTGENE